MRSFWWIPAVLIVWTAVASGANAQGILGMPAPPEGSDWAPYMAPPGHAPAYGTYGSVVPGTYDCPSCCLHVWDGYCQKRAMLYQKWASSGCGACSGETPRVKTRHGCAVGCAPCTENTTPVPDPACAPTGTDTAVSQAAPPKPLPAVP